MPSQSLELFKFFISFANSLAVSLKDGKINISDLVYMFDSMRLAPQAFEGIQEIPKELADLSPEYKAALYAEIEKLDLANDQTEAIAEKVLKGALNLAEIVLAFLQPKVVPAVG